MPKRPRKIRVKTIAPARRAHFVFRWTDADGTPREQSSGVPIGTTDRDRTRNRLKAERLAAALEAELNAPADQDATPLGDLLDEYETYKRTQGHSRKTISQCLSQLRQAIEACQWKCPQDIDAATVAAYLDRQAKKRAARTTNSYLETLKAFCNWLVAIGEVPASPISFLRRRNAEADRRRIRRALTADEVRRLVEAAKTGPVRENIPGLARATAYAIAAYTGLRLEEIAALRARDVDLASDPPRISAWAGYTKSGERATLPVHPALAAALREWFAAQPTIALDAPLLPLTIRSGRVRRLALTLRRDLEAARLAWIAEATDATERARRRGSDYLEYRDRHGHVADFHALRHTFITSLARAGVPLSQAQKLARHSDPRLTAEVYTHLDLDDAADAIDRLPGFDAADNQGRSARRDRPDQSGGAAG